MAELDTSGGGKHKGGKVRSKKSSMRVDLTAMVDLAFLLITFFMLTTTLMKAKAMDMAMPDKDEQHDQLPVPATRTMTILLGSQNKLEWYMGETGKSAPTVDNFGKNGLRKALLDNKDHVMSTHGGQPMIVLIKPSDKSTYADFVEALDELNIAGIDIHAVVDITDPEIADLKKNGLY
ncbi:biopolymer transporter ExbD [uncultured Mucilaginibacter sp.]|uniref:ExbD/TolR family protein n=1 Tax=uncultured Mucilaginibacter sp. TaxID=797541 RepID=UPI0025FC19E1|nr:biopolymer transporter ExbD [uncultured Mucilaginibacter sp.]